MTVLSSETLHASCVAIGDLAVLIQGHSGAGKSDLALRLVDRGAKLVSDDYTLLLRDGTRFFLIILKIATFFSPFRVFFPLSLLSFLGGTGWYLYTFATQHRFTNMSMLLIVQGVMLFALALISEQVAQLRFDRSERREA